MISFRHRGIRLCDGLSRREWFTVGGASALGIGLPELWQARSACGAEQTGSFGRAKSCILIFLLGGPPQHETWDPKPDAPPEIRGDIGSISTSIPAIRVGELMPMTAMLIKKIAVVRSMATDDNAHSSSGYWMLTGYPHSPKNNENATPGAPNDWPCVPAVVRKLRGDRTSLPGAIRLPEEIWNTGRIVWPGQNAGWLGDDADPWLLSCDPNELHFRVGDFELPAEVSVDRLGRRLELLDALDRYFDGKAASSSTLRWTTLQQKSMELLRSPQARRAFAIDSEPEELRERYGRNRFGQSLLLARRLVEIGVSMVQVNWTRWKDDPDVAPAWDTHAHNSERLKHHLMPPMDQGYSALLEDLDQRGLLEETLVVWMGEFGRSPRINPSGGRDHWGHVFSVALAGGGIQGGIVHGVSDRQGGFPLEGRVGPHDLSATIFHCLGIPPDSEIRDRLGRPLAISQGEPIRSVLM